MMNTRERGRFLGVRRDQLGARLLMICNCIRLSGLFETSYLFDWFPPGNLAPHLDAPEDIFSDQYLADHLVTGETFADLMANARPIWQFLKNRDAVALKAHLDGGGNILVDEGFEIIAFPWEEEDQVRAAYRAFIRRIGLNEFVLEKMRMVDAALGETNNLTAYHIRRGDILNTRPWCDGMWPAKVEPDELYEVHIAANPDARAIVFSDQPESAHFFGFT